MVTITTNSFVYNHSKGSVSLSGDAFKYALIGTYALLAESTLKAMTSWTQLSANEISGTGYIAGGKTLSGKTLTETTNGTYWKVDNLTWTSSYIESYGGVLYRTSDNLAVLIHKFNDDGSYSQSVNGSFQIIWNPSGTLRIY